MADPLDAGVSQRGWDAALEAFGVDRLGGRWEALEKALAAAYAVDRPREPSPELREGDVVIEVTKPRPDFDSLGVLVGHDQAPYHEDDPLDGSVPMREVWDVRPLLTELRPEHQGRGYLRWENSEFVGVHHPVFQIRLIRLLAALREEQGGQR